ncbi:hypothetical protein [Mycolicibacterium sp. S3B2]|uniref:hypothetical protein n=1 Tax=Mycolicibacterium sp. S3B2 TaxID=3415120 RepID=UPI003C7C14DA
MDVATGSSADARFAEAVLRKLLQRIEKANSEGRGPYLVSHAWTAGPMLYVVYTAPPSDRTWGLARDTTESVVDPGPWPNDGDAARYYYLVDFEENQPSNSFRRPGDDDSIWWFGHPRDDLPERPSGLPKHARHRAAGPSSPPDANQRTHTEPRRYGNRLE